MTALIKAEHTQFAAISDASRAEAAATLQKHGLTHLARFDASRGLAFPSYREIDLAIKGHDAGPQDKTVQDFITALPVPYRKILAEFGTAIWTADNPEVINAPSPKTDRGGFYESGRLVGIFVGSCKADTPACDDQTKNTAGHEIGHAVNVYLGRLSWTPFFTDAYKQDFAALKDPALLPAPYKIKDVGGMHDGIEQAKSELFAELFFEALGRKMDPDNKDHPKYNTQTNLMPRFAQGVEKIMADIEKYYEIAPEPLVLQKDHVANLSGASPLK